MEQTITVFTVYGKVQGKQRPRFTKQGRCYTPKATEDYEAAIAEAFRAKGGGFYAASEPVGVSVDIYRALPKKTPKRVVSEPDVSRPDVDNVAKAVLDALNGLAYADDAQVVKLTVTKHQRAHTEERITVSVWKAYHDGF